MGSDPPSLISMPLLQMCTGYIHMGFHNTPTEDDMERLEAWINHNVLHASGVMHKTAHLDWDFFS